MDRGPHLWIALAVLATGCGDQCRADEAECDGKQIRTCDTTDDIYADWRGLGPNCGSGACIDLTVDGLREAVCSTTGEPDPACPSATASSSCNAAGQDVSCDGGYSTIEDCVAEGEVCVDAGVSGVFCSLGSDVDPACVDDGPSCDGSAVVECYAGHVVGRTPCDGASSCATSTVTWRGSDLDASFVYAYCVSATPCAGSDRASCGSGGRITGCIGGAVVAMTCGPGLACDEADTPWGATEAECVSE